MSTTWGVMLGQIGRKLNDESHATWSEDLLRDCVNDALRALASTHTGYASDFDITGDGSTWQYDLPSNIVQTPDAGVYAVLWDSEENAWLKELDYWPNTAWESSTRSSSSNPLGYVLWPQGKISFSRIPADGQEVTVHYVRHYYEVTSSSTVINVPTWALEAIKLYTCAAALEPMGVKTGKIARFKTRRESGDPEDNPVLLLVRHYMDRYHEILRSHSAPQYALLAEQESW